MQIEIGLLFSSAEIPVYNKITLLVLWEGIPITVIMYHCVSTCCLSAVIMISEQVVPSAVVQCIIVKFLTNKNMKPAEILMILRAHFGDETLSKTQVCNWNKSFKKD